MKTFIIAVAVVVIIAVSLFHSSTVRKSLTAMGTINVALRGN